MTGLTGNERTAWMFFGLGCLGLAAGETIWGIFDVLLDISNPSPSIADVGYLSAPVLYMVGIWHYQVRTPSADDTFVRLGNLGIILSSTLLVYLFAYSEFIRSPIPISLSVITVAYGILDLSAALFALIIVSLHTWGPRRRVMLVVFLALCFQASTDFSYISQLMSTGY